MARGKARAPSTPRSLLVTASVPSKLVVDLSTGSQALVPLSAAELADQTTRATAESTQQTTAATNLTNFNSALDTFIAQADGAIANWATLTALQKDTAQVRTIQALRALARQLRGLNI